MKRLFCFLLALVLMAGVGFASWKFNPFTGKLDYYMGLSDGLGDVVGPASATDHAVARFNATTGKLLQNGVVLIGDTGIVTGGTWQGTIIAPTYGGAGASTVGITGYPYMTLGIVSQDTIITRITGGAKITNLLTYGSEYNIGNSGATKTIDWGNGGAQKVTLTDTCTFTFTAPASGVGRLQLKLIQGGIGSWNPVWPGTVKWPSAVEPTWSTTATYVDIVTFWYDGTNYNAVASLDFR
jgi:hypothetical protein